MMHHIYRSDYSNQFHQLLVSVSRHYFITKKGKYQYQKKPFEVQLGVPGLKLHAVHYMIRDHFSGLFYVELTDSDHLFPIDEFLFRAWSTKPEHPFCGIPWGMSVPKNIHSLWPSIEELVVKLGVRAIRVTSGFQGGIRDLRTWEDNLKWGSYESGFPPDYEEVKSKASEICCQLANRSFEDVPKSRIWRANLRKLTISTFE